MDKMGEHKFPYRWTLKDAVFTKDKGKVFSCFACGGGSTMGYKLAGFDVIGCNEIDPRMNKVYVANHHPRFNFLEPIQTFKLRKDLPKELYQLDILDGSPPCFAAGTKVCTKEGYKNIEDVKEEDMVLTHKGRFQKVAKIYKHDADTYYDVKFMGTMPIKVTPNHPFYVRRMVRQPLGNRVFGEPFWCSVEELCYQSNSHTVKVQDYVGIPVNQESRIPEWEGVRIENQTPHGGHCAQHKYDLDMTDPNFWCFVGRWVGDGRFRHSRKTVILCCGKQDKERVEEILQNAKLNASCEECRTGFKYHICKVELYTFMLQFGSGAINKHIPQFVLDLPTSLLDAFYEGYMSADGHYDKKRGVYICSSISIDLMLGMQQVIAKLKHKATTFIERKHNTDTIEGRKVNVKVSYAISFHESHAQEHAIYQDRFLWVPFRKKVKQEESLTVYNLHVEEDESYTVFNVACHNCSSFSTAGTRDKDWGKKKKFREGQSEQVLDTLFFDFIDLVKELQPKIVVAENVKGLLLGTAKAYVTRIHNAFEDAGYYVIHQLLDASRMGVPQRRERTFFTAIRKDLFDFIPHTVNLFEEEPLLDLSFSEPPITLGEFADFKGREITSKTIRTLWDNRRYGDITQASANERLYGKPSNFGQTYNYLNEVSYTLTAKEHGLMHFEQPRYMSVQEVDCISTFPQDYNFLNESPHYICGMSVPPVMCAQVATRIYEQWLSKIGER